MNTPVASIYGIPYPPAAKIPAIQDLRQSGFSTVIAWALHVQSDGQLVYNDTTNPIINGSGEYIGSPQWPGDLAHLKNGGTVRRLLFSIGGWGVADFPNIQQLIKSQGTGPGSALYRSFQALKQNIPAIDGIDLDDESLYDQSTTVEFSRMLNALGYEVTFCPYNSPNFWIDCLHTLNTEKSGLVTGFNLQCYAGGSPNVPADWIQAIGDKMGSGFDAKAFVTPGLWCRHGDNCETGDCPESISQKFANWKSNGIQSGFIWAYGDVQKCADSGLCVGTMGASAYSEAIVRGLSDVAAPAEG